MRMRLRTISFLVFLFAPCAYGQVAYYTEQAIQPVNVTGVPQPVQGPIPYAQVRVCSLPLTQTAPCLPLATITDQFGNTLSNSIGSNFGQTQADSTGRITFGCTTGTNYQLQYSGASNTPQGNHPISCGGNSTGVQLGANNTFSGSNTFTGAVTATGSEAVTAVSMGEYLKANVNSANSQSIFQQFYNGSSYNTSPITGAMIVPNGATKIQATSVIGLIDVASGASGTAGVALGGYARATVNNSHTFGLNTNASDCTNSGCGFTTTSTNLIGYEADCNANNSGSTCVNVLIRGIYNTGSSAFGLSFATPLGTKGVYDYGIDFNVGATLAPTANNAAIRFQPIAAGVNQQSQGPEFVANDPVSGQNFANIVLTAAGNLQGATSKAGTGWSGNAFNFAFQRSGGSAGFPDITGNGSGALVIGDTNGVKIDVGALTPSAVNIATNTLGSAALPWKGFFLGTAATNNFNVVPAATAAARTIQINDPGATSALLLGGTNLLVSPIAPTMPGGTGCGGTAASIPNNNGTAAFTVNVGTAPTSACTITLPAATTGWACFATDITTNSTGIFLQKQTGGTTTTAVITNFSDVAAATAFAANDILRVSCHGY
jgi:hypothetical protein